MAAIRAFVGFNGSGKTLAMVEKLALPSWAAGRPVVSNFRLDPAAAGYPEFTDDGDPMWMPLTSWRMIPMLRNCTLLLDEITAALPSRQAASVPPELARILNQLRKPNVPLGWTAPAWARADKILRECTQSVTVCRAYLPDRWEREPVVARRPPKLVDDQGDAVPASREWPPNRLFCWRTFDAYDFEEFSRTQADAGKVRSLGVTWHWRTAHRAYLAYSTQDTVDLLDYLTDSKICPQCEGTRSRPRCTCTAAATLGGRRPEGSTSGAPTS